MPQIRRLASIALALTALATTLPPAPAVGASTDVRLIPTLTGYDRPLLVANHGGTNRVIYIVEQGGRIERAVFRKGAWKKLGTFLDLSRVVFDPDTPGSDVQGLLGLAFHPNYRRNGRFYVFYTRDGSGSKPPAAVVAEYRRKTAWRADPASARVLLVVPDNGGHNGGHLAFGPDGMLYISLGDGGGHGDPFDNGQDRKTLFGSLLRIDPRDPDGRGPKRYRVPGSNPLVGRSGRNEIWAWGLRNPWRYSFDPRTGDLWIGDVGDERREEVDKARSNRFGRKAGRGLNFGWSDCEGGLEAKDGEGDDDGVCEQHRLPTFEYATERGNQRCSVTGGYVHRGPDARAWRGLYVAGDFCGWLFVLGQGGRLRWSKDTGVRITSFGQDAAGRLFAVDIVSGILYRVKMTGPRP